MKGTNTLRAMILSSFLYHPGVQYFGSAYFGHGSGSIFLDNVTCNGSEASLLSCSYSTPSSSDTHSEDVGVKCLGQQCFTRNMHAYKIKLHVNTHIFGPLTTNRGPNAVLVVNLKGC